MDEFNKQYKDVRWENKRLEIYRRDNWHCRRCQRTKLKLNAHHLYYDRGLKLWEYENESLVSLCDDCHKHIHIDLKKLAGIIAFKMITGELDILDLTPLSPYYEMLFNNSQ